jgi:hypothetical protein
MLSPDSFLVFPKDRPEHRTFFEIYGDRVWLRQEGDTVHMNSWGIFPAGGSDPDSPYSILADTALHWYFPPLPPVLKSGPPNGSAVGFRLRVEVKDVLGRIDRPSESMTYPRIDPTSQFYAPEINGSCALVEAGRAYASARAVDGDSAVDARIDNQPGGAAGIVDRVDAGGGSAEDRALRSKILTFYVDHPPRLVQENASFLPTAGQVFTSRSLPLDLIAVDDDPFDGFAQLRAIKSNSRPYSHVGGPKGSPILRRRIAILGKYAGDPSRDTCWVAPGDFMGPLVGLAIPDWIANGPITVLVRLCDCFDCDVLPGPRACPQFAGYEMHPLFGTCVDTSIPCQLAATRAAALMDH